MFCTHCGNEVEEHANFCSKCGKQMTVPAPLQGEEKHRGQAAVGDVVALAQNIDHGVD